MPTDFVQLYATARGRIIDLVRDLPEEAAARRVPGCPEWTVRELVSHLSGVANDLATGNLPTAGLNEWTAAQVEKRQGMPLPDLLAEWEAAGDGVVADLPGPFAGIMVVDLIAHEHDLRVALDRPDPADPGVAAALRGFARMLGSRVDEAGLPALAIEAGAWSGVAGSGEPGVTVRGEAYDVFRTVAGRRTEAEVRALDWSADPAPYLAILNPFGPLPATSGG